MNDFGPAVPWHSCVWFSGNIQKHAFITWLSALNRLYTRDRLQHWEVTSNSSCLLCYTTSETRSHLFFSCPFSQDIWPAFSPPYHPFPLQFDTIITWIPSLPSRISKIVKPTFQASLYAIWRKRNSRFYGSTSTTSSSIVAKISRTIRNKLFILDRADERSSGHQSEDSNKVL